VATIVSALAALQIDPDVLVDLLAAEASPKPCPNQTCPRFIKPAKHGDPLTRKVESHCPICGSRFVGRRILLTFDLDHGSASPTRNSVLKAQRRLRRWKVALRLACADLVAANVEPTVGEAFARARVPKNANLRAERLGLVAIVRDAARRHRLMVSRRGEPFYHVDMDVYRELMQRVIERDWIGIAEWGQTYGQIGATDHLRHYLDQPKYGILEPLFNNAWARRVGPEAVEAVWAMADEHEYGLLSDDWHRRIDRLAVMRGQARRPGVRAARCLR
jgi:hypothetical protein